MKILLDTHVFLWWLNKEKALSSEAGRIISDASVDVFVSSVTALEISIKKAVGKLEAPDDFEDALQACDFKPLSVTVPHALLVGRLPYHHKDPFDRLLIDQALVEGLTLVTRDAKQRLYDVPFILA